MVFRLLVIRFFITIYAAPLGFLYNNLCPKRRESNSSSLAFDSPRSLPPSPHLVRLLSTRLLASYHHQPDKGPNDGQREEQKDYRDSDGVFSRREEIMERVSFIYERLFQRAGDAGVEGREEKIRSTKPSPGGGTGKARTKKDARLPSRGPRSCSKRIPR